MTHALSTEIDFREEPDADADAGPDATPGQAQPDRARFAAGRRADAREGALVPELVVGQANFLPTWFLAVGAQRAAAVCKITAGGVDYRGETHDEWSGTGFLVAPDVLLTNHHVLNSAAVAAGARAVFNYELDADGRPLTTKGFRLDPAELFVTSAVGEFDFTFVRVKGRPGDEFPPIRLDRSSSPILAGEPANIVQHPRGRPKALALQENRVQRQGAAFLHYVSDTEPGSSGSPVFDNGWRLVALHHASRLLPGETRVLNEGIKIAAIAAHLETLAEDAGAGSAARELLGLFGGTDSAMGFFGALGRSDAAPGAAAGGVEAVVAAYRGEARDVDVGFWNVEWFSRRWREKVAPVAEAVAAMNLDVWAFEEASPEATDALVARLRDRYGLDFGAAYSEPGAAGGAQTTTVIWNAATVRGGAEPWPAEVEAWLRVDSRDFGDLALEAEDGPVFPRRPGLFRFAAVRPGGHDPFDFRLVPLHLKAMGEGARRRRMASRVLAAAIRRVDAEAGGEADWVIGGDFNAALATGDFQALADAGLTALSAEDERQGAFSYLKRPRSLIDHVYLSANLARTHGASDYFIVARDRTVPHYLETLSDHRPVLVRLSLADQVRAAATAGAGGLPDSLRLALRDLPAPPPAARRVPQAAE